MEQIHYLISDAAKQVEVESHVLRYWEVELGIPIKRNELGHRYYTKEDIDHFKEIKRLKEKGLQLKAIRMFLKEQNGEKEKHMIEIVGKRELTENLEESKEDKTARLQILLQHMIAEAVKENNRELCEDIKECILKEMDYQFRQQEDREEERETERRKRADEHYQKIDELIRYNTKKGKKKDCEKEKRFFLRKKPSIV